MGTLRTKFNKAIYAIRMLAIALPVLLIASACKEVGNGDCQQPFSKVITPVKIQDGHDIYFNIGDFDFASDPTLVINDITLSGNLSGHKKNYEGFSFSINGIKASRHDGNKCLDRNDEHNDGTANFSTGMQKFYLNGGDKFSDFMLKVKIQHGELRLQLHGEEDKVNSALLTVTGEKFIQCPTTPPPPPPPAPVAPVTTIASTNPATSPTDLTNMVINFTANQANVTFSCSLDGATPTACTSPVSYSGLGNGTHTFKVLATNSAGLSDVNPPTYTWSIDTVPPVITINNLSSLPTITNNTAITVLFSSTKAGTFTCSLDGASAACTSPVSYSTLKEGQHTISISEVDALGNVSSPAIFQWTVDLTAPIASIISVTPPNPVNNSTTMSIQFSANESSTFTCSIDHGAFQACASPLNLTAVIEGSHWFAVQATDVAGNVGLPVTYSWTADFTPPVITLGNVLPATSGETNSGSVSVDFLVNKVATVKCSFDGVITSPCTTPFTTTVTVQGSHTLILIATDVAGNVSQPQTLSWTMDFTLPTIAFGQILPSASAYINVGNLSAQINPSEPVTFTAQLNGVNLVSPSNPIALTGLMDGSYVLSVRGIDAAGNPSNTITHNFTVDTVAPTITVTSAVGALTNLDHNTLTFTASETVSYLCNIDGAGYASCASPLALAGLADGTHTVLVKAYDLANNMSAVSTVTWTVDTIPPKTTISGTAVNRNTVAFTFGSNEANSTFTCAVDTSAFSACTTPMNYTFTDGQHTFTVKATDAAGNTDPVGATYNFTAQPAVTTSLISESPNTSLTNQTSISFAFTSNLSTATFRCALDSAAFTTCVSPASYTGLADGTHKFVVQAVDMYGTVDASGGVSYSWTIDTVAPVVSNFIGSQTSSSVTVTWTTNKPATTMLNWGLGTSTSNVVPDDGVYATTHSVRVIGLISNTTYSFLPGGHDQAGNNYTYGPIMIKTSR